MLFFHLDVCQEFMYKSSKYAFCKMCVTIYGKFCSNKGVVAGYGNQIRAKYIAKWGVQIMGMIFCAFKAVNGKENLGNRK